MTGIISLLSSDHGIFSVLLVIAATVLCALGIMTIADWENFTKFVFATFGVTTVGVSVAGALKKPVIAVTATNEEKS